jgi:rRNA biogenesis protein RRP5
VGSSVTCRILDVDSSTRKARATLKRSLVESKLPPLACAADAVPGAVAHGVITGVQAYGCFVEFFNKVKAMAHKSHLGLLPDEEPTACFQAGQVVKCTVIGPDSSGRGLRVSFSRGPADPSLAASAPSAAAGAGEKGSKRGDKAGVKAGGAVGSAHSAGQVVPAATVKSINAAAGLLEVALPGGETGVLEAAHLSDYVDVAKQLFAVRIRRRE